MKKLFFILSFILSFANIENFNETDISKKDLNNFEIVSTKYTYFIASDAKYDKINKYRKLMYKIDEKKAKEFENHLTETKNILTRVFKTNKNLAPKFIQYIYFEPIETDDIKIKNEILEKLIVSCNANTDAKIFINSDPKTSNYYINILKERNINMNDVFVFNLEDKLVLEEIKNRILIDFNGKKNFGKIENRIELIVPSSIVKEKFSLLNSYFKRDFKGIVIDDFPYLDEHRINLEKNSKETILNTYRQFINGIY